MLTLSDYWSKGEPPADWTTQYAVGNAQLVCRSTIEKDFSSVVGIGLMDFLVYLEEIFSEYLGSFLRDMLR